MADKVTNLNVLQLDGSTETVGTPSVSVRRRDASGNVSEAQGATLPTDGDAGYAKGAKFVVTGGAIGTTQYINEGSSTSADFNALSSGTQTVEVSITNAEMLALRATPKTLVAAPGAGKMLEFVSAVLIFDYTGAYTETADNMAVKYTDGSGAAVSQTIEATGFVDATADTVTNALAKIDTIIAASAAANKALVLHNTGDGEYGGGNAANAIRVKVTYRTHTTGL